MKRCKYCTTEKTLDNFYRQTGNADGLQSWCKTCVKKRARELYPSHRRYHVLKHKYGITREQYESMLLSQNGVCAACKLPPRGRGNQAVLSVDHDHGCCNGQKSCGKCIRGLICHPCNIALGYLEDDSNRIVGLLRYVKRDLIIVDGMPTAVSNRIVQ